MAYLFEARREEEGRGGRHSFVFGISLVGDGTILNFWTNHKGAVRYSDGRSVVLD